MLDFINFVDPHFHVFVRHLSVFLSAEILLYALWIREAKYRAYFNPILRVPRRIAIIGLGIPVLFFVLHVVSQFIRIDAGVIDKIIYVTYLANWSGCVISSILLLKRPIVSTFFLDVLVKKERISDVLQKFSIEIEVSKILKSSRKKIHNARSVLLIGPNSLYNTLLDQLFFAPVDPFSDSTPFHLALQNKIQWAKSRIENSDLIYWDKLEVDICSHVSELAELIENPRSRAVIMDYFGWVLYRTISFYFVEYASFLILKTVQQVSENKGNLVVDERYSYSSSRSSDTGGYPVRGR